MKVDKDAIKHVLLFYEIQCYVWLVWYDWFDYYYNIIIGVISII